MSSGPLDIFDKGKTGENRRRKATGLKLFSVMTAGPPNFFISAILASLATSQARDFEEATVDRKKIQDYGV